jgi:hypothetical protein
MHIRMKCVLGLGLLALAAVASAQVKGPDPSLTLEEKAERAQRIYEEQHPR